jgi:hypothetical protein
MDTAPALRQGCAKRLSTTPERLHPSPGGIEAQSPDVFMSNLLDFHPVRFVELLREQAAALVNPPITFDDLLAHFARAVPDLVASGARTAGTRSRMK